MDALEQYLRDFSAAQGNALDWLEKETHLRTNHARMLSGRTVGALLHHMVLMTGATRILELGTFTGYSAISMASALGSDGRLDTVEVNDEMEDLIREGFRRAGVQDRINLIFGDAKVVMQTLEGPYDLIYIDANKREYVAYYQDAMELVRPGGYIIADNVLWDGKVYEANPPRDMQTRGIMAFNDLVVNDDRVENFILPLRDGLNVIRKKNSLHSHPQGI